jgi:hypothetical protein
VGIEGPTSSIFGPSSAAIVAAVKHRVGDASECCAAGAISEHRSVATSDYGSGTTSITVT